MLPPKYTFRRLSQVLTITLIAVVVILACGQVESWYMVPNTVRPSDSNFVSNPAAYGELLNRLAGQSGKPCDVIFIGASNVERFISEGRPVWDRYYAPRHAFNFAVTGDKTENVLWRFDHMDLSGLNPKVAVIFVGLNNVASTPLDTAVGVEAVVEKAQSVFPGVKVLLVSLTPNFRNNAKVVQANEILRQYADNRDIFYVDIYSYMPRVKNNWRGLCSDRLHLSARGYEMWAEQMEPLMRKLLSPLPDESTAPVSGLTATAR